MLLHVPKIHLNVATYQNATNLAHIGTHASILSNLVNQIFCFINLRRLSGLLAHLVLRLALPLLTAHRSWIHRRYNTVAVNDDTAEDPCRGDGNARRVGRRVGFLGNANVQIFEEFTWYHGRPAGIRHNPHFSIATTPPRVTTPRQLLLAAEVRGRQILHWSLGGREV